jgi:hypothetical protein
MCLSIINDSKEQREEEIQPFLPPVPTESPRPFFPSFHPSTSPAGGQYQKINFNLES